MTRAEDSRTWRQANPAKVLAYQANRRARLRGVICRLTPADVSRLLEKGWVCRYCESPVGTFAGRGGNPLTATLDRIIPEEGYTPENTILCCHRCNTNKGDHTPESLRKWAERIEAVHRQNQIEAMC